MSFHGVANQLKAAEEAATYLTLEIRIDDAFAGPFACDCWRALGGCEQSVNIAAFLDICFKVKARCVVPSSHKETAQPFQV